MANFKKDFEDNREVAGVGGWFQWQPNAETKKITRVGQYLHWLTSFSGKIPNKSPRWALSNLCGNTANVCYRKSALKIVGGFNHYYPAATAEDVELAIRMHKAKFALLYMPRMVLHQRKYSLHWFIKNNLLRGLANYITNRIHTDYNYLYLNSGWNGFFITCKNLITIWSSQYYTAPLRFFDKFSFTGLVLIMNFCLAVGKYSMALNILKKQIEPR